MRGEGGQILGFNYQRNPEWVHGVRRWPRPLWVWTGGRDSLLVLHWVGAGGLDGGMRWEVQERMRIE
jgi:hypothetical protein